MTLVLTILVFILIFSLLVLIHEWGHFSAAKRAGVKVEEFGFGLPPRLYGIKKGETLYSINWIPFGGFVRMLGEDSSDAKARRNKRSFANQPLRKQAWIVSAGVVMNFVLAFILLTIGFLVGIEPLLADEEDVMNALKTEQIVLELAPEAELENLEAPFYAPRLLYVENGTSVFEGFLSEGDVLLRIGEQPIFGIEDVELAFDVALAQRETSVDVQYFSTSRSELVTQEFAFSEKHPIINRIEPGSPAEEAGLQLYDEVLAVESQPILLGSQVLQSTALAEDGDVTYQIRRDGVERDFTIPLSEVGRIGIGISDPADRIGDLSLYESPQLHNVLELKKQRHTWAAPWVALQEMWRLSRITAVTFVGVLGDFLTGSSLPDNVSGPVGIAQMTFVSLQAGFSAVLRLVALLSLSLGVINILPIPALDGGRLFFILVQAVTGKAPNPKVEALIHSAGFLLLIAFIFYITFNDVLRLI